VGRSWLIPRQEKKGRSFSEADVARAHFIRDLKDGLGVNDDAVEVILSLAIEQRAYSRA
jgi:chaperone modulatory protein CbpM